MFFQRAMEGKLVLRYFDIRGKAELIRLTLEEAGVKYEEVNFNHFHLPQVEDGSKCNNIQIRFQRDEWYSQVKQEYVSSGISQMKLARYCGR